MIYFVRHGQTINNVNGVFYGQNPGPGLTALGREQAQTAATKLKDVPFDVCYCSPRIRAKETMEIIMQYHPNTPVIIDDRLAERNWGEAAALPTKDCEPHRWQRYREFPYAGVESVDQMQDRLLDFYQSLDLSKNILVVAHQGVHRISYALFHGAPADNDFAALKIPNGDFAKFDTVPHRF